MTEGKALNSPLPPVSESAPAGPLEYASSENHHPRRRWVLVTLYAICFSCVAFAIYSSILPSLGVPRSVTYTRRCQSNLRLVGLALIAYAEAHQDQFPDSLASLVGNGQIKPEELVCPGSSDTPLADHTTDAVAAALAQGGHCSYIYVGKGLNIGTADSETVLAYEPLADHEKRGMHVLFSDGHIEFLLTPGVLPWVAAARGGPVRNPQAVATTEPCGCGSKQ